MTLVAEPNLVTDANNQAAYSPMSRLFLQFTSLDPKGFSGAHESLMSKHPLGLYWLGF